jgi:Glyoxalase-like domain
MHPRYRGAVKTEIDHLVVAAATLEQGVAWCEATLGIAPTAGGRHPLMGTHNRVFHIGSAAFPGSYFEIVAIDPTAPAPPRKRWFGLDDAALQARIAQAPQLVHAVARTTQLDMHRWGLVNLGLDPGLPLAASRETPQGLLSWQILVRDDGALLHRGALPTLIQWQGTHPTEAMQPSGVELRALQLSGLPPPVQQVLQLRGVAQAAQGPALRVVLNTPKGEVILETAA